MFQFPDSVARQQLGFFPTPLVYLKNLSNFLNGPRIYMKRDDQTGLATGGNKTRKLEFLMGDALAKGCDTIITGGAAQSNHCRQTAAAAAGCGLKCHLVLGGEAPPLSDGNLLLDMLLGSEIHWTGKYRKGEKIPYIAEQIKQQGKKPYVIPYGGSNSTGAMGFVDAIIELTRQLRDSGIALDAVIFASSSGGTHAGLMVGKEICSADFDLVGIGIDKGESGELNFAANIASLATETSVRLNMKAFFSADDVILHEEYTGKGYGMVSELEQKAIKLVAETEGILLDPVYTGRAMGALLDLIKQGKYDTDETILFWHTGGLPALFSYAEELQND